ncbi:MAG: inorganic diphosphatase [Candidatus Sulfotelmatobacter sp.]
MKTSSKEAKSKNTMPIEQVVVETPRGSRNKYKFDEKTGRMKLSKVMPEGMMFPYDFGFLPNTKAEDGDPLDVLILSDEPTFPACQIACRLIGVIQANQREKGKEKRNDRLIAVATASVLYARVEEIEDLEPAVLKQVEDFFVNYQKVRDIEFKILARNGSQSARKLLEAATARKAA